MSAATEAPTRRLPQRRPMRERVYTSENEFDFDKSKIPPGMRYGWKRMTIAGMEDRRNQVLMERNQWAAVPAARHPELMGSRATDDEAIIVGGQMLMELPEEWAKESDDLMKFEAANYLEQKVQSLGLQARQNGVKGGAKRTMDMIGEIIE